MWDSPKSGSASVKGAGGYLLFVMTEIKKMHKEVCISEEKK